MAIFEWSEVFFSIEGEGKYAGHGVNYLRLVSCNMQCQGFNNPEKLDTTKIATLGFDPKDFKVLTDIPPITRGCDSIYSWDRKFAHMWKRSNEEQLANHLLDLLPNRSFISPSGKVTILSITGGEPTLRAKFLPQLFHNHLLSDVNHILIETNCSVPLNDEFIDEINKWLDVNPKRRWTWSNSPKLSQSGEPWEKAIRPEIALTQTNTNRAQSDQYFKFVCDQSDQSFDEVAKAMDQYYQAGISRDVEVYVMPVACQDTDQTRIAAKVAEQCMKRGYIYCHRVHLDVFGNAPGT